MVDTIEETQRIVPVEQRSGLVVNADLADLTDDEFESRLIALTKRQERIDRIKRAAMVEGADYGNVPGTDRPTLLKGGAEKLTNMSGLVARIETQELLGDGEAQPPIRYRSDCWLHVGSFDGPIVGHGEGICSVWEDKYNRTVRLGVECPDCGRAGLIFTRRGAWWHPDDASPDGGCGANFAADDARLLDAKGERLKERTEKGRHPNPWDVANTLLKMAEKRAHVDAVLRATGVSGLFTQDLEDGPPNGFRGGGGSGAPEEGQFRENPDLVDGEDWSVGRFRHLMRQQNVLLPYVGSVAREKFGETFAGKKLEDLTPTERRDVWTAVVEALEAAKVAAAQDEAAEGSQTK